MAARRRETRSGPVLSPLSGRRVQARALE